MINKRGGGGGQFEKFIFSTWMVQFFFHEKLNDVFLFLFFQEVCEKDLADKNIAHVSYANCKTKQKDMFVQVCLLLYFQLF